MLLGFSMFAVTSFDTWLAGCEIVAGIASLFVLVILLPNIAVTVRRIRDVGLSGWFVLSMAILEILLTAKAESTPSASIANALIIILYIAWLVLLTLPSDCFSKRGWWSPKDD